MTRLAILAGKLASKIITTLNLGAGATWPGQIALWLDKDILGKLIPKSAKIILVAGTNGKTTTAKLLYSALGKNADVIHNPTGANVLNGLVGSLIISEEKNPKYVILETDEATLPIALHYLKPEIIVLLNLFRDQLDRYGEVDTIAQNWKKALEKTDRNATLLVNADDPHLAWIGENAKQKVLYFGLGDKKFFLREVQHATDSIYCPNCGTRLTFAGHYFSHLGQFHCPKCGFSHPKLDLSAKNIRSPLEGVYNLYNSLAATLTAKTLGSKPDFSTFSPAFGRLENIGKTKILLSKNPTGFNESLRTVLNSRQKGPLLLVLNDRIPDGRDVSWVWDVDFEELHDYPHPITVSGDRTYDLALRLKYAGIKSRIEPNLSKALDPRPNWILPTYSAMLEVRKILTGRKIL